MKLRTGSRLLDTVTGIHRFESFDAICSPYIRNIVRCATLLPIKFGEKFTGKSVAQHNRFSRSPSSSLLIYKGKGIMLITSALNAMTDPQSEKTKIITAHLQPFSCGWGAKLHVRFAPEGSTPENWNYDIPKARHEGDYPIHPGGSVWVQRNEDASPAICVCDRCKVNVREVLHTRRITCEPIGLDSGMDIYYYSPREYKWNECEQLETPGSRKFFVENTAPLSSCDDE